MIPDRDYYADKSGKLTDDPEKYASQIATRGCYLDDAIARRHGITEMLVSTDEPAAPRRMRLGSIKKDAEPETAAEPAEAAEPEAEEPKAAAEKPAKKTTTKEKKS